MCMCVQVYGVCVWCMCAEEVLVAHVKVSVSGWVGGVSKWVSEVGHACSSIHHTHTPHIHTCVGVGICACVCI